MRELARRYHLDAARFDELPWHYQRMYLDLLNEEIEAEVEQQEKESGVHTERVSAAGDLSGSPFKVTRVNG